MMQWKRGIVGAIIVLGRPHAIIKKRPVVLYSFI